MIPLFHDFSGETVLIFGGGRVGARKARRFAREARVVVVSPAFADADWGAPVAGTADGSDDAASDGSAGDGGSGDGRSDGSGDGGSVEFVRAAPDPDDVGGWIDRAEPALVVAATDDGAVNDAVAAAARERGRLVNRADRSGSDRGRGSVVIPATVRDDPVTVAISTGGRSPALARELRRRIETEIEGAGAMAALTADLRAELKADGADPDERRRAVRTTVQSPSVWKALRTGIPNGRKEAERVIRNERGESR